MIFLVSDAAGFIVIKIIGGTLSHESLNNPSFFGVPPNFNILYKFGKETAKFFKFNELSVFDRFSI